MDRKNEHRKKLTPAEAVEILRKQGLEFDEKEAAQILDLMYSLAKLIVNQNFK